jgi:hypothetical protein
VCPLGGRESRDEQPPPFPPQDEMGWLFVYVQFHTLLCKQKATTGAVYSSDVSDDYYVRGLYGFGVLCVLLGVK